MENHNDNKDYLRDTDVDPRFINSTNGEISEDELNYQTSEVDSKEMTSTMKWKILVRRLGSDMNDEYHEKTIDPQDELNYQTSKINSTKTTSTMKWKILVKRLGSDMNDKYHKETIDFWKTKVVV